MRQLAPSLLRACLKTLAVLVIAGIMSAAMNTATAHSRELAPHLFKSRLDNGVTVITRETPGSGVATVQIWVKAGSVYETEKERGITHLIEHMIFKGTETRGPGELAAAIERLGGRINAYTSYEYTVYHATLTSDHWQEALSALADALLHATFDAQELEREKPVVLEEIRMRRDRPNLVLYQELMRHAYTVHPYRHPISGSEESVQGISRDDILAYIAKHYHPANFTVVAAGDVRHQEILEKTKALLGGLPPKEEPVPEIPQEPPQDDARFFLTADDIGQTHLALAFPASRFASPDTPVLDVMTHILGQGETSRLYRNLRTRKGLVYKVDASAFTPRDPGLIEISAVCDADKSEAVIREALTEIFKLKYVEVSDEELERAKRILESDFVFNLERVEGIARVLGNFEFLTGDPRETEYLDQIRSVSKEDILKAAKRYLKIDHLTAGLLVPKGQEPSLDLPRLMEIARTAEEAARHALPPAQLEEAFLPRTFRYELTNGIRLLVREDHQVPTVAVRAVFPGGLRSETTATNGAFAFIAELLPKGTEKLPPEKMAKKLADMAAHVSGFNGKNTFGLKGDFLSRFFKEGMEILRDILLSPGFDPGEAERVRAELLAQLRHQEDTLPALAFREFNRHLFRGHPYGLNTIGTEEVIQGLSVADLKAMYDEHARPDKLVLGIAGDVDAREVKALVEHLFGSWAAPVAPAPVAEETLLPPDAPASPEIVGLARDKQQVHIILGFLGTTLASPDRFPLEILDNVLSGQSGRLFTELRDKQSLAYSLSSFSLLGLDTGSFGIYIGTSPDRKDAAIKEIWKQLYRVREEPITAEELDKARNILISNYRLGLQTHGNQAMEMALNELYGLGQDFGRRYVEELGRVEPEEVLEIARKYIQPDHYVLVTVGAEPEGSPQAGEPPEDTTPKPSGPQPESSAGSPPQQER